MNPRISCWLFAISSLILTTTFTSAAYAAPNANASPGGGGTAGAAAAAQATADGAVTDAAAAQATADGAVTDAAAAAATADGAVTDAAAAQAGVNALESRLDDCIAGTTTGCQGADGQIGLTGPTGLQGPPGVDGITRDADICLLFNTLNGTYSLGLPVPNYCANYAVGDVGPAGGFVFYIDPEDSSHGLEAAPSDVGGYKSWGCTSTDVVGADETAVGTGKQNTADLVAAIGCTAFAAVSANDYSINGFDDWFLPSLGELNLIQQNLHLVGLGGFENTAYWSSSEFRVFHGWKQNFNDSTQALKPKNEILPVRPVRAF